MQTTSLEAPSAGRIVGSQSSIPETEQPRFTQRETLLTMLGVLLVLLLASLDQTIVSTAMPQIIGDLHGLEHYTWVTTAYLLTSTIMIPIYGKLSDIFGRKPIFIVGVILFLIGSALSGAAQSMNQLIAFRAFQGLGAAALMPIAMAVIGDLFTPRERGKWQGIIGAVFGLSSILGPTAGGWITQNSSWRWVFYVNLPIGAVALAVLIFLMPALRSKVKNARIDYIGALLLAVGVVPLMLGLSWGGSQYDWLSPQIIGLLSGGAVVTALFFVYEAYLERRNAQPILDPSMFQNGIFSVSALTTAILSMGMFGCIFFLPLYAQGILGIDATNSGLLLAPMMVSLMVTSVVAGQIVSATGKYKWIALAGMVITIAGAVMLLGLDIHSTQLYMIAAMVVLGLGLGFGMSLYTMIVQNAMPNKIGQATSALTFFRQIGSTLALSAMGSIMSTAYVPAFHDAIPASIKQVVPTKVLGIFDNPNILLSKDAQQAVAHNFMKFGPQGQALYNQLMDAVKVGLAQGIHNVFVMSTVVMVFALVSVFFLKEIPMRGGKSRKAAAIEGAEDGAESMAPVMMH